MLRRTYLITGAFGALGSALARATADQDVNLGLVDYAAGPAKGLPAGALALGGVDLADASSAQAAIDAVADRFGGLDALINVAGGFRWEMLESGSADTWATLFRLNVQTAVNASRAAIPHLRRARVGRIVNVGANAALKAAAGMGPYAASKAGVHSLTQALAEELKSDGVTVNAVLPSILDTPANRADMPEAAFSTWVRPEDLAAVMLFLAGETAGAVTGALIPVTGQV